MTNQEMFNFVWDKLAEQGCASSTTDDFGIACLYRGPNGLKCAAGHLIPDEAYNEQDEYACVGDVQYFIDHQDEYDLLLLSELQVAHDNAAESDNFIDTLFSNMNMIADDFDLIPVSPQKLVAAQK